MEIAKQQDLKKFLIIIAILLFITAFILFTLYRLKVSLTKSLEQEIEHRKRAEQEMLRSLKLETVGILAGRIAQDFNRLIGIISDKISTVREKSEASGLAAKMLASAERASTQAADLVQKLATFSDKSWVETEKIAVKKLLEDIREHYPQNLTAEDIIELPGQLPVIYGDERQLRQVFISILDNAHDSMKDREIKRVRIDGQAVEVDKNNLIGLEPGIYVQLRFIDNGEGIKPEIMKSIFDPYFSTKNTVTQKGLGLGLALCYTILKKHNGHIAIESEVGKGTTVSLWLPAFLSDKAPEPGASKNGMEMMSESPVNLLK
jgi:signal transduction histidine kinase